MKARDLLYVLRRGILNDRSNNAGASSDLLWDDELLITYMNEAYRRMAVEGLMLRDAITPEVTQVAMVAGQRDYALHEAVVSVLSARPQNSQFDLTRSDHPTLSSAPTINERMWDPEVTSNVQPSAPRAFTTDEGMQDMASGSLEQITLRLLPIPGTAQNGQILQLRVIRKPLVMFSSAWMDMTPELPEEWHMPMLDWAASLALRIVDDDAGSPARAAEFASTFEANVAKARNQILGKLNQGTGWQFGRGGFTWGNSNGWW